MDNINFCQTTDYFAACTIIYIATVILNTMSRMQIETIIVDIHAKYNTSDLSSYSEVVELHDLRFDRI